MCDLTKGDLFCNLEPEKFPLRNLAEHIDRIQEIEDAQNTAYRKHLIQKYGIKGRSPLLNIPHVNLFDVLINDIQHVYFEGIDQLAFKHYLVYFVNVKKYFGLDDLNTAIKNYPYTQEQSRDKPCLIQQASLQTSSSLKQTAASMIWLVLLFPFLVGQFVAENDPVWANMNVLRKINLLILSPVHSRETPFTLKVFLTNFFSTFFKLFPNATFTPKCHYALHSVLQIVSHGPLRNTWNMRFEAKHGWFKDHRWRNYKNLCKTMAERHQKWMCFQQTDCFGNASEHYLYEGDHVRNGRTVSLSQSPFYQISDNVDSILLPDSVKIHGRRYLAGSVLLESLFKNLDDFIKPVFLQIVCIGVVDFEKFFYCEQLDIICYSDHFGAYKVCKSGHYRVIKFLDLLFTWPQLTNYIDSDFYVTLSFVPELL